MFSFAGPAFAQDVPPIPEAPAAPETPDLEALQADIQQLLADVQGDPANAAATIQAFVDTKVGEATSTGLTTALGLLTKIAAPVCPAAGQVASILPVRLNLNYPPLSPVGALDKTTSETLYQTYKNLFSTLVTPLALPPEAAPVGGYVGLVQALLGLLKVNWHTTYYPPNGGAPIVRDTPAFLNLPMILDVDGQVGPGGYELCATMTLDLATGNIGQQIARMPLSRATLPVDVKSEFLGGVIAPGYETKNSNAPYTYQTALGLAGTPVSTQISKPGPTITQTLNLTSALQWRWAHSNPPASYAFAQTHPGRDTTQPSASQAKGNKINYSASSPGGSFDYGLRLGSLNLGVGTTPSPASFEWCSSTRGYCSNEPGANPEQANTSQHLIASQPVKLDQHALSATPGACTAFASAASNSTELGDTHITGDRFFLSALAAGSTAATSTAPATQGFAWADTDGHKVTGCVANASVTGVLPDGFLADDRKATWGPGGLFPPPQPLTKTGTIVCPTGTAITGGSFGLTFGLSRYLCPTAAPVNVTLPTISSPTSTLRSATNGTWTPSGLTNPDSPTFAKQWLRCDNTGAGCTAITGATGTTYTRTAADSGKTLRVQVTATNFAGSAQATSLQTAVQP
jgi:hypothetical protein